MAKPPPKSFSILQALERISGAVEAAGPLSRTRLLRYHSIPETTIDEACDYGCDGKYIRWSSGNMYSHLRRFVISEEHYYPPVMNAVSELWLSEGYGVAESHMENTSRVDSKIQGPWTRPDLTLVSYRKFPWTIGYEFDVTTFEVKRPDSANVLAVFEALAHRSAATRAYVVFPVNAGEWAQQDPEQERRVREECARHGVGLILVENVVEAPKAHHIIKSQRKEIDHEKSSSFLEAVLSPEGRNKIAVWK